MIHLRGDLQQFLNHLGDYIVAPLRESSIGCALRTGRFHNDLTMRVGCFTHASLAGGTCRCAGATPTDSTKELVRRTAQLASIGTKYG